MMLLTVVAQLAQPLIGWRFRKDGIPTCGQLVDLRGLWEADPVDPWKFYSLGNEHRV
jgi:hypothetical protein